MIHFISGLPRSGSTLLASLLRQNPRFHAHVQSPIGQIVTTTIETMSQYANESALFLKEEQRVAILRGIFSGYYHDHPEVVFDSNRRWCAHMALLAQLFPGSKVIACVRPVAEIIDSFERLFMRDPTQVSRVLSSANLTLNDRINRLMGPTAVVGYSNSALQDAYFGPHRENLAVLEFRHLVSDPLKALQDLHNILQEPWYEYDVDNVASPPPVDMFDEFLSTPTMHTVGRRIAYIAKPPLLPAYIARSLPQPFWITDEQENYRPESAR